MMPVRNFHDDLALSDRPDVVQSIIAACFRHWPELRSVWRAHPDNDILGIDYFLEFPNGQTERLDAKIRRRDFSLTGDDRNACIELLANTTTGKIGWSLDSTKLADWILFVYLDSGRSYAYNARQLRAAVRRYLPDLKARGEPSLQRTGGYASQSLFVSHENLSRAIERCSQSRAPPTRR